MVDQIDCSKANKEFRDKPGEPAYPREMLLRIGFDECYLMVDCLLVKLREEQELNIAYMYFSRHAKASL